MSTENSTSIEPVALPKVLVGVPVYKGLEETRRCLESIQAAGLPSWAELFLLNDASPDATLAGWLREFSDSHGYRLEESDVNRGFVASANRIFDVAGDRDVILLNADTVVNGDWIDRLRHAAYSREQVATVTPFSNNATLASYPKPWQCNPLLDSLETLDAACRKANLRRTEVIPVGVGFCMYLTRSGLELIGRFSVVDFGFGYGEEVDYCLRATTFGWMHLLAADVFVAHEGGVSFGERALGAQKQAERRLLQRYPDFHGQIESFRKADPLAHLRERIGRCRLSLSARPRILLVTHAWQGGVWQHLESLIDMLAEQVEFIVMQPADETSVSLAWSRQGENWRIHLPASNESCAQFLRELGISRVHVHHLRGHQVDIADLARSLEASLDVTLHDYHLLSDEYQLLNAEGVFDETVVDSATATFARGSKVLLAADRVISPSEDVARRHARYVPGARYQVVPHPEQPADHLPRPLRILVLGALSKAKGLTLLEEAAREAKQSGRLLHFILVGYAVDAVTTWPELPLEIRGEYSQRELSARLAAEGADLIWFPARWPETYSYTLSAAIDSGIPVLAPDLGAFTERLQGYPMARLLSHEAPLADWLEAMPELARQSATVPPRKDNRATYCEMYLAAVSQKQVPAIVDFQELPQESVHAESYVSPPSDLESLFENGVQRGHRASVEQLRSELGRLQAIEAQSLSMANHLADREAHVAELGAAIDAFKAECVRLERDAREKLEAAEHHSRALKDALHASQTDASFYRRRAEELEASTSWKLTRPVRALGAFMKRLRQKAARGRALFEISGRRLAIALDILRQQGPGALYRRVRARLGQGKPVVQPDAWKYRLAEHIGALSVPLAETPLVSIIIPVYGQHQHTFSCLQSIVAHTRLPVEVLVIDDVSPIPVADALHAVSGIRLLRNDENRGFIRNCNLGAQEARGEFIVLLNNDTLVTEGWMEALLRPLQQDSRVGVVGAKLIYPDGSLQEAGGILWRDGSAWNYGRGDDASKAEYNYLREVDYVSGACFAVRRTEYLAAGGFDEAFAPAYCEDSDFCLRMASAGKKVIYQPACTIVHFEGVSNGTDTSGGLKAYQVRNSKLLYERWKERLANHRSNGVLPNLERERGVQRRFLYIDATMVTPDQDSGSVRVRGVLKTARDHGCKVTFIADNLEYKSPYIEDLQQLGVEVRYWPELRSIEDYLEAEGAFFDVIILSRYYVAEKHIAAVRKHAPQALVALDTHDLHYLRLRRLAELEPSSANSRAADEAYAKEMAIMQACDVTLVVSPVEQEILAKELPGLDVRVFTNIHDVSDQVPPHAGRSGMMFVGGYRHPPNVDAVLWYAREVLPLVKQRLPGIKTTIIGSNAPKEITDLADEALEIVGFVPDMTPYLESVRVSISPLRYGAGVKGKINQAMAHGLPVVGTSPSVEGMFLRDGVEVLVADSPEDFAEAIARLHTDSELWQKLSEASLENVRTHFSSEAAWRVIDGMMADAEKRRRH
jgi:O-antigen biosynthesis protein